MRAVGSRRCCRSEKQCGSTKGAEGCSGAAILQALILYAVGWAQHARCPTDHVSDVMAVEVRGNCRSRAPDLASGGFRL